MGSTRPSTITQSHWIRTSGISRLAGSPTILGFTHHNLETFKGTVSNNTFNTTCHCHRGFAPITQFDLVLGLHFSWQLEAGPVLVHANLPLPFYILSTHWRFSVLFIDPVGLSLQNGHERWQHVAAPSKGHSFVPAHPVAAAGCHQRPARCAHENPPGVHLAAVIGLR